MDIAQKFKLLKLLFPSAVLEDIDQHLMEVYQMDLTALNKLKTCQSKEYHKIRDEELVFLGRTAF